MGKTKPKELQDIMDFPVINRLDVTDEKRFKVAREVNQQLYEGLLSVKGADYLREKRITSPEQWDNDNFWEKGTELRGYYQKEYSVQQEAQVKGWREGNYRRKIGSVGVFFGVITLLGLGYAIADVHIREGNDAHMEAEKAKADYFYCQSLLLKAQSEETKAFVNKEVTAPNSGRLCELVLAEEYKSGE